MKLTGVEMIKKERARQVAEEGCTPAHDDDHTNGELALAAACYATPVQLYQEERRFVNRVSYVDPWPWESKWDKRYTHKSGNRVADPATHSAKDRLDMLVKAGALVAAEIDRLLRQQKEYA